ncbi:MAG: hypothetical protein PHX47_03515 [Candidatus ainarchaeum sp.]|nr:hypothetical protein [Candidatus ainarchaeum sp.]NCP72263.1 hypothetical protein [archaeon]NCP79438.1 hypothetical protein [archaeon]NCP97381.1 hypothetical protein [archaeon]NCQ07205.1 hypothetical protein [archaeon]
MKRKIKDLRNKKNTAENHSGVLRIKSERFKIERNLASQKPLAMEYKSEYKQGCLFIKKILDYKQKNKLIFFTGKQAGEILKKYPKLDSPEAIKSILIASSNPNLNIKKINSIVSEIYSKKISEKERKDIIFTMIRSIKIENYEYLL